MERFRRIYLEALTLFSDAPSERFGYSMAFQSKMASFEIMHKEALRKARNLKNKLAHAFQFLNMLGSYLKFHEFDFCQPTCEKEEHKKGYNQHDVRHFFCFHPRNDKQCSDSTT
jgi:hypothetical protein